MTRNPLSAHSRFGQRIRRRYESQLSVLQGGIPDREAMASAHAALLGQGNDMGGALRITRQLVLERLLRLDCDEGVTWDRIAQAMTDLAVDTERRTKMGVEASVFAQEFSIARSIDHFWEVHERVGKA